MLDTFRSHVSGHGRVSIPVSIRRALNLHAGAEVFFSVEGGSLVVTPADAALARFQDAVAAHVPPGRDLVAELIADRRAEAARGG